MGWPETAITAGGKWIAGHPEPPPRPVRGRRPGQIPRTTCPHCGREYAQRDDGRPFRHRIRTPGGPRLGFCPGGERYGPTAV